ncbi:hypothetical protein PoB_000714600, partial [Plakobranchus ocellatus]
PPAQGLRLFVQVVVSNKDHKKRSLPAVTSQNSTAVENRKKKRKGKRRRWRKQSKIRVFLSNSKGKRQRRIAELRKVINESGTLQLVLPVSLISSLSSNTTDDKLLYLRLQCKRCSKHTQFLLRGRDTAKRCAELKKRREERALRRQNKKQKKKKKRGKKRLRKLRRKKRLWRNCEDEKKGKLGTFIYRYARQNTR